MECTIPTCPHDVKSHWRSKPTNLPSVKVVNEGRDSNQLSTLDNERVTERSYVKGNVWDSPILLNKSLEDYKLKNELIRFNHEQNSQYKNAMELMDIAIIGPKKVKKNYEYNIITDNSVKDYLRKKGLDFPNDNATVLFNSKSSLTKEVESSDSIKKSIINWYNHPENKRANCIYVEINDNPNLFRSINKATIYNPKVKDGYFYGYLCDEYDFRLEYFENFYTFIINTGASVLQALKKIEEYNIIIPIKIKLY